MVEILVVVTFFNNCKTSMMNYKTNSIRFAVVGLCFLFFFASAIEAQVTQDKEPAKVEPLVSLGVNRVPEINESSGLAVSTFAKNSIWTHNDSGHTSDLFLMKMSGQALAKVKLFPAKNVDWESMCGFKIDGKPYLMVGDVGDNTRRREKYQFYVFPEPDLTSKLKDCLLYTSPSPRDRTRSRMPSSA